MSEREHEGDPAGSAGGAFEDFLDALETGEGYYLACSNGHGSLPPRLTCPRCGDRDLTEQSLPDRGTVETFTVVSVATPSFEADVPYATAIADFGSVRLTGVVRDTPPDGVEVGMEVTPGVGETETTGERVVVLRPV